MVVLAIVGAGQARADAPPPLTRCDPGWYLEPSVLVAVGLAHDAPDYVGLPTDVGLLHRLSAGALLRKCDAGRRSATHVRLGASAYFMSLQVAMQGRTGAVHPTGGGGVEVEVDRPIAARLRAGGRVGFEYGAFGMATIGARLRLVDTAWIGLDTFILFPPRREPDCADVAVYGCFARTTGVMVGAGFDGVAGKRLGVIELGALGIAGILFLGFAVATVHG